MKDSRSFRKAKKHDLIFEVSILSLENGFYFIIFTNFHLIIGIDEIQLGESFYLTELIQRFANQRQQILIFDDNIIKILIIYTKTKASIWLSIKKNKCSGGRFGRPDKAIDQVGFNIVLQGL